MHDIQTICFDNVAKAIETRPDAYKSLCVLYGEEALATVSQCAMQAIRMYQATGEDFAEKWKAYMYGYNPTPPNPKQKQRQ